MKFKILSVFLILSIIFSLNLPAEEVMRILNVTLTNGDTRTYELTENISWQLDGETLKINLTTESPEEPEEPQEPENPDEPDEPDDPGDPGVNPEQPGDNPDEPEEPAEPEEPEDFEDNPEQPGDDAEEPEVPEDPGENPDIPDVPEDPDTPNTPDEHSYIINDVRHITYLEEKITTAVDNIRTPNTTYTLSDNGIRISSPAPGSIVAVYSINGQLISQTSTDESLFIELPRGIMGIVTLNGKEIIRFYNP